MLHVLLKDRQRHSLLRGLRKGAKTDGVKQGCAEARLVCRARVAAGLRSSGLSPSPGAAVVGVWAMLAKRETGKAMAPSG